jgi:putative membrane protein
MRYFSTAAFATVTALSLVHCGGDQKPADAPSIPSAEPPAVPAEADAGSNVPAPADSANKAASVPAAPPLTDEQIAAITDAANTAEIAQAKLAESKSKNPEVKRFAAMMIEHHGAAKKKQATLKLTMADSPDSTAMKADADTTLTTLKGDNGKDFDKAYIDAQVDGHQKVLDAINGKLLPSVKSPELKAYLDQIKPKVEQHLAKAKEIQLNFQSKSSALDGAVKHSG